MARSDVPVPYLELLAGGAWWTVGAGAFDAGTGTVVLAAGLGVTGWLLAEVRRRNGGGERVPLARGGRGRLLRLVGVTVLLIAAASAGLAALKYGELAVPIACVLAGAALLPLSSVLEGRSLLAVGAALMVLGAVGALLALSTAGALYPRGVVGLLAGALLWVAAAHRTGLLPQMRVPR